MLAKVRRTIARYGLLQPGDRVVVAVSGGPDSVALLHCLWRLREEWQLHLHVAHLNHMFRGEEALGEARFVEELAHRWGLGITVEHREVGRIARERGISSQEAGRWARYDLFNRLAQTIGAQRIALGHHGDDQAETLLMRLLRGSGATGLRGMAPRRGPYIRPLLGVRRKEIEAYCAQEGLTYCLDSSNQHPVYLRNKIRLELLPLLEREYNPEIGTALMRTAEVLREEDAYLEELTEATLVSLGVLTQGEGERPSGKEQRCPLDGLLALPLALQRRVVRRLYGLWAGPGSALGLDHVDGILLKAATGEKGILSQLPGGAWAVVNSGEIRITGELPQGVALDYCHPLKVPGDTPIPETGLLIRARVVPGTLADLPPKGDAKEVWLDYDRVPRPLEVRVRRPGDYFCPSGLGGRKKLKEFFIDAKVPQGERDRIPIIAAGEVILWVGGMRDDERFKATEATRSFLHLCILHPGEDGQKG